MQLFRYIFPDLYHKYRQVREWFKVKMGTSNHYFAGTKEWLQKPEKCVLELNIPEYVDTILDLGTGNGRNLIPFNGRLRLIAIDLAKEKDINWIEKFKNFHYMQTSVEQLTRRIEVENVDMSRYLVFSSGTLMMLSKKEQERFVRACKMRGCVNFIFQEPAPDNWRHPLYHFKLSEKEYQQKMFRGPEQPVCYYKLTP